MSPAVREGQTALALAWMEFDPLSARLDRYLKTSDEEFVSLIEALDACWSMAETVQQATTRLAELAGAASGSHTDPIRQSMFEGCSIFRQFLGQLEEINRQLASAARETVGLLATSNHLQKNLAPLKHIAFYFRVEGSRLSAEDSASVLRLCEEMREVLNSMKEAGDSQQRTLVTVLEKLSTATRSVEQVSADYAKRAGQSEEKVQNNLDLLATAPTGLLVVQQKAKSFGSVVADGIREAVKVLQGHDAIRQRLEHILSAVASVRQHPGDQPGHALLLQQHQARSVLETIIRTGSRIEIELNGVIAGAQSIAGDSSTQASGAEQVEEFEQAVDHLAALNTEVAALLGGEVDIGNFVLAQIAPIRDLLSANTNELEGLAQAMEILALNVLISADKMPSARGIGVLGNWASAAAERVLKLARDLNGQFARLADTLQSQASTIAADVQTVECCRGGLVTHHVDDALRSSRRAEYDEVTRLSGEARRLQKKTETLVQSLKFVEEGTELLGDFDSRLEFLLALYPKSDTPFDLKAASAGYTMQEQHAAHAAVGGDANHVFGRLVEPVAGQDYGANVELF